METQLKNPYRIMVPSQKLPTQNAFRTIDWGKIKQELEPFIFLMQQKQALSLTIPQ